MKIGVFDSGVGGQSVVDAIKVHLPQHEVIYKTDKNHIPYGDKPVGKLYQYVLPILNTLSNIGCEVIVIACNTVSTNLIDQLRDNSNVPLIAMEPMIKPAAELTKSKTIAVCATPMTLKSPRYNLLKAKYAEGVRVIEPDCSNWASMIESKDINLATINEQISSTCDLGADVIVLGCTHYHWIENQIKLIVKDRAQVLQPELPVIEQLKRIIASLN